MSVNIADLQPAADLQDIAARVDAIDWSTVEAELDRYGCAHVSSLLSRGECDALRALYPHDALYRSRVVMARHGFGRGEYKYFAYPLPAVVDALRATIYPHLAPIANRWNDALRIDVRYPLDHAAFLDRCHDAGQTRPTPLILQLRISFCRNISTCKSLAKWTSLCFNGPRARRCFLLLSYLGKPAQRARQCSSVGNFGTGRRPAVHRLVLCTAKLSIRGDPAAGWTAPLYARRAS
nr:2OG-Fe(II) oxygenase [Burkholderia vietnamiensis]